MVPRRYGPHPPGAGAAAQWYQVADLLEDCIEVGGNTTGDPDAGNSITFTVKESCPDCYINNMEVFSLDFTRDPADNSVVLSCANQSVGGADDSKYTCSFTVTWPSTQVPVWFKMWFACDQDRTGSP